MTWAIRYQSTYGKFAPDGKLRGYVEALEENFRTLLSDEEREVYKDLYRTYRGDVNRKFTGGEGFVRDSEWPTTFRLAKSYKEIGAIIEITNLLFAVNDAVKKTIEALEPNVHRFNPIVVETKGGKPIAGNYHVVCIGQYLDCFDVNASDEGSYERVFPHRPIYATATSTLHDLKGFSLDERVIAGKHLWRDNNIIGPEFFVSDSLRRELMSQDLVLQKFWPLKGAQK